MLSVRLPQPLERQLSAFCEAQHITKSAVVQLALEKHLNQAGNSAQRAAASPSGNPFAALRGIGNRKLSTEQIMRMTRGDDWNQS